jgi:hypothetical protein
MIRNPRMLLIGCCVLGSAGGAFAVLTIDWSSVDGGAGVSTGGTYEVSGAIGQPDASAAGQLAGGPYTLTGGFWAAAVPVCNTFIAPDLDRDCDVDGDDLAQFTSCKTREKVPHAGTPLCQSADFDSDGDVDLQDFAFYQRCFSRTGVPANPACAP